MNKIIDICVKDIRFPTSLSNLGSDSVHVDCDYSASYVEIITDNNKLNGIGLISVIAINRLLHDLLFLQFLY